MSNRAVQNIQFQELAANGTNYVELSAPDNILVSYNLTLPTADGASGTVLQTDGLGNLSFVANTTVSFPRITEIYVGKSAGITGNEVDLVIPGAGSSGCPALTITSNYSSTRCSVLTATSLLGIDVANGFYTQPNLGWSTGNNPLRGGFTMHFRVATESLSGTTSTRVMHGLNALNSAVIADFSTLSNVIAIGYDTLVDTNWQILHSDATIGLTKIDTGIGRSANQYLDVVFTVVSNSGVCNYTLTNCETGVVQSGSFGAIPISITLLGLCSIVYTLGTAVGTSVNRLASMSIVADNQ